MRFGLAIKVRCAYYTQGLNVKKCANITAIAEFLLPNGRDLCLSSATDAGEKVHQIS